MLNKIKYIVLSFLISGVANAVSVTPESFSSGLNTGYSVSAYDDVNNNVDWFVFDSNGIDSIFFDFDRTSDNANLFAALYTGDTTGFDYSSSGAFPHYSVMWAGNDDLNSDLTFLTYFDNTNSNTIGLGYGDPSFDMILAKGRYSLALSSLQYAGTYDFTTNAVSASISPVPVPAAAWLFGSALLGFFGFSRKKASA